MTTATNSAGQVVEAQPVREVAGLTTTDAAGRTVAVRPIRYADAVVDEDELGFSVDSLPVIATAGLVATDSAGNAVDVVPVRTVAGTTTTDEVGRTVAVCAVLNVGEPDYGDGAAPLAAGTVTWLPNAHASDVGGWLVNDGSAPAGAIADGAFDASLPIAITVEFDNPLGNSNAAVVLLDTVATANYVWSGLDFLSGALEYSGTLYHYLSQPEAAAMSGSVTDGGRIRIRNDGDDLVYYTLAGAVETVVYRDAGILAGQTALYLKVVFAETGAGRRVKVTVEAQA